MPTALDDWINKTLATLPNGTAPGGINPDQILKDRPDVLAEYNDEAGRDAKSQSNLQSLGIYSPQDYASWWADHFGYTPAAGGTTPTDPTTTPTTPATGTTTPTTTSSDTNALARTRALANAQLAVQGRGLDFNQYSGDINSYLDNIFAGIPAGDTNPSSYIDPNFADTILNGKQQQSRIGYENQVQKYSKSGLDYHSLDGVINGILGDANTSGENLIQNGLKRGQFNEVGAAAGETALGKAKAKAQAKLDSTAQDVFNTYDSKFGDLYNRAYSAASGYQLGQDFNPSSFDDEFSRLQDSAKTDATGQLYSAIGDSPLINLSDIRGAVGQGQGSTNLQDLDVLDALAKRKQASGVGRGLGSQGAF